ncbi:MAG: cation-translocating P-type ATPase [Anaerolineales bacterium]
MSETKTPSTSLERPEEPWSQKAKDVLEALRADPEHGLTEQEAKDRKQKFGPNRLRQAERRSAFSILIEQFKNIIVVLLAAATAISFAFGEVVEGFAIVAVIVLNALIGFFTELRAVRSMEALRELGRVESKIRRAGSVQTVEADEVVPGDILVVDSGDVVTADARLLESSRLQTDESALTGESVPVAKQVDPVDPAVPLAERASMIYKGTAITRGSGEAVAVSTGMDTELGGISSLVEQAEEEVTPLETRLDKLGERLVWVTLGITAFLAIGGIIAGREIFLIIETSLALAVAAVPEGLPIVATVALARGMHRMAQRNALLRKLSAVETLGSTTVILSDKTGTLTENEMTLQIISLEEGDVQIERRRSEGEVFVLNDQPIEPPEHEALRQSLRVAALCNNAELNAENEEAEAVGDPLEIALLRGARLAGYERNELLAEWPEYREIAFDPEKKMMATIHKKNHEYFAAVKGAPEAVFDACRQKLTAQGSQPFGDEDRADWSERVNSKAAQGYRVLALAGKEMEDPEADPYENLTLLGLVGLLDPARGDVQEAIEACRRAGVHVVMVTGDQAETAKKIADQVALTQDGSPQVRRGQELSEEPEAAEDWTEADIFARVSPKQKLSLVNAYQQAGDIVAMTGDGVNDAPALKKADIGIAMGRRGTQVAKEAAAMVLQDDAFSTIVVAIEHGRAIFNNIRKFVIYLLSCNMSEILVVTLASFANLPLPIRPLQILFLNLVTDVFPALALGLGEADPQIMKKPPRDPSEPILTRDHWTSLGVYAALITLGVMTAYALALFHYDMQTEVAITIAFLTLAGAQLWHVFNMRSPGSHPLRNEVTTNPFIWGALALCVLLLLLAVYLPPLAELLGTVPLDPLGWLLVTIMSVVPLVIGQALKALGWGQT